MNIINNVEICNRDLYAICPLIGKEASFQLEGYLTAKLQMDAAAAEASTEQQQQQQQEEGETETTPAAAAVVVPLVASSSSPPSTGQGVLHQHHYDSPIIFTSRDFETIRKLIGSEASFKLEGYLTAKQALQQQQNQQQTSTTTAASAAAAASSSSSIKEEEEEVKSLSKSERKKRRKEKKKLKKEKKKEKKRKKKQQKEAEKAAASQAQAQQRKVSIVDDDNDSASRDDDELAPPPPQEPPSKKRKSSTTTTDDDDKNSNNVGSKTYTTSENSTTPPQLAPQLPTPKKTKLQDESKAEPNDASIQEEEVVEEEESAADSSTIIQKRGDDDGDRTKTESTEATEATEAAAAAAAVAAAWADPPVKNDNNKPVEENPTSCSKPPPPTTIQKGNDDGDLTKTTTTEGVEEEGEDDPPVNNNDNEILVEENPTSSEKQTPPPPPPKLSQPPKTAKKNSEISSEPGNNNNNNDDDKGKGKGTTQQKKKQFQKMELPDGWIKISKRRTANKKTGKKRFDHFYISPCKKKTLRSMKAVQAFVLLKENNNNNHNNNNNNNNNNLDDKNAGDDSDNEKEHHVTTPAPAEATTTTAAAAASNVPTSSKGSSMSSQQQPSTRVGEDEEEKEKDSTTTTKATCVPNNNNNNSSSSSNNNNNNNRITSPPNRCLEEEGKLKEKILDYMIDMLQTKKLKYVSKQEICTKGCGYTSIHKQSFFYAWIELERKGVIIESKNNIGCGCLTPKGLNELLGVSRGGNEASQGGLDTTSVTGNPETPSTEKMPSNATQHDPCIGPNQEDMPEEEEGARAEEDKEKQGCDIEKNTRSTQQNTLTSQSSRPTTEARLVMATDKCDNNACDNNDDVDDDDSKSLPLKPMAKNFVPGPHDVMCGIRGARTYNSPGNVHLIKIIQQYLPAYSKAATNTNYNEQEIGAMLTEILDNVRGRKGAFVKKFGNRWYEMGDADTRTMVESDMCILAYWSKRNDLNKKKNKHLQEPEQQQMEGGEEEEKTGNEIKKKTSPGKHHTKTSQSPQPSKAADKCDVADNEVSEKDRKSLLAKPMGVDFVPGPHDVICGVRGGTNNPGNVRLRKIIQENLPVYSKATTKQEKGVLVTEILDTVRERRGAFVQKIGDHWYEMVDADSRKKVQNDMSSLAHRVNRNELKKKNKHLQESEQQQMDQELLRPDILKGSPSPEKGTKKRQKNHNEIKEQILKYMNNEFRTKELKDVPRSQIAKACGYSMTGTPGFFYPLQELKQQGVVDVSDQKGCMCLTAKGMRLVLQMKGRNRNSGIEHSSPATKTLDAKLNTVDKRFSLVEGIPKQQERKRQSPASTTNRSLLVHRTGSKKQRLN